ncbi:MAG: hypothetical protein A3F42_05685 [Gammaproteobacteria bacterium RIFCSPHIGHO2_12_FULL_37_34]|nr:MAG: hypothetical protein A3F42_05685 [Gammaproteobacteria bacterium RIFCSPHIGHO2_12_FULL_37_34]
MGKNNKNKRKHQTDQLIEDDAFSIHESKGNGVLRRQIWVNTQGEVIRYSLAYINHHLFTGDNGRVLGYDNAHGYHHKHLMGEIESITYKNFADLEKRFQREFEVLHEKAQKKK